MLGSHDCERVAHSAEFRAENKLVLHPFSIFKCHDEWGSSRLPHSTEAESSAHTHTPAMLGEKDAIERSKTMSGNVFDVILSHPFKSSILLDQR